MFWDILQIRSLLLTDSNSHFLLPLLFFHRISLPVSPLPRGILVGQTEYHSAIKHTYKSIALILLGRGKQLYEGQKKENLMHQRNYKDKIRKWTCFIMFLSWARVSSCKIYGRLTILILLLLLSFFNSFLLFAARLHLSGARYQSC